MEAGGGGDEDDTDIAQLWEELPELANAREATAAFTFDPTAQYVAPAPLGTNMPGHVHNVMQKDAASPSKEGDDVVASPPGTAMASAEKAAMKVAFSSKKRKTDEEQEQPDEAEDEDEPDMKWACEITTMRLLKKAKKEHLIPLLEDFGVPTKGSKEELSTLLSEQLHYETDSGDDDE